MLRSPRFLVSGALVATGLVLSPVLHAVLLAANLALHLAVLGAQAVMTRMRRATPRTPSRIGGAEPFVSILVPAHNEPPEILVATLRSLAGIRWSAYEVLVVDNNTSDEALWRPVEAECRRLGPRFRFLHVEGLKGFKAGAMNWARP